MKNFLSLIVLDLILAYWWVLPILGLVILLASFKLILRLFGILTIPEDSVGIVNKRWVLFGKNRTLPDGAIIALNGEAGFQADTLAPGIHYGYFPWQYSITKQKFVTVQEGYVGIVEARDGKPLSGGRVLARKVLCDAFQNARAFLTGNGERGPQIDIIPPGTYRINTALFTVAQEHVFEVEDNMVGIITTKDGAPLVTGDIAGKEIAGHNMFQDAQAFINNGGFKGLQEQVILAGRYYFNPRFVTVELKPMTDVPIAHVGVVIAYVGEAGIDLTGEAFRHGNLVSRGQKGVWADPLDPGKYPINTYTHKVEIVPTANVVLNWATGKTESHNLDKNLSTITVRSSDGFTFNLDVSQIIHIPRTDAPKVIARFGNVENLVTQVLEPTIGNYFRNSAQKTDVIDFLKERSERQESARKSINEALDEYNVGAIDTLIGDITPPEALMKTLTDRKIADQEKITYETQRLAEDVRKSLQQARATADTQASVVNAERSVEIKRFEAAGAVEQARGAAESKTINATADAAVTKVNGEAEANKIKAIGQSEADVQKLKVESVGADNYARIMVGSALSKSGFKLVPDIVAGESGNGGSGLVDALLALTIKETQAKTVNRTTPVQVKEDES